MDQACAIALHFFKNDDVGFVIQNIVFVCVGKAPPMIFGFGKKRRGERLKRAEKRIAENESAREILVFAFGVNALSAFVFEIRIK